MEPPQSGLMENLVDKRMMMKLALQHGEQDINSRTFSHPHNVFTPPSLLDASKGPAVGMQAIGEQSDY